MILLKCNDQSIHIQCTIYGVLPMKLMLVLTKIKILFLAFYVHVIEIQYRQVSSEVCVTLRLCDTSEVSIPIQSIALIEQSFE